MTLRDQIVAEARTWKGTPFQHLARCKGAGVDCIGLVVSVAKAMGFSVEDRKQYPRIPIHGVFSDELKRQTDEIKIVDVLPGDMLAFTWRAELHHVGIVTCLDPMTMVHAYATARLCVEDDVDSMWHNRIVGAYRFKELAD
ncbi:MAG: hypothetical protein B7Z62_02025 [Deltaproteobacteria bacterium 37-65-8]|nr:MAG: hypothetical protein B7Z62_02025 [Deltaproteobacteria bacterium 37-65-8]